MATYNTIVITPTQKGRYDEGRAGGAITPGHLIMVNYFSGTLSVHNAAGGYCEQRVAIEDALQGKTIDDAYASGDLVRFHLCKPGDVVYLVLAASQTILNGNFLTSNGDGAVKKAVTTDNILFTAIEAVTTSGSVGRVRARAISPTSVGNTTTTTTTTTTSA